MAIDWKRLYLDTELRKSVSGILRKRGVLDQDVEDGFHDVFDRLLLAVEDDAGITYERTVALTYVIAMNLGVDALRRAGVRGRKRVDAPEGVDEMGALSRARTDERLDAMKAVGIVDKLVADGEVPPDLLEMLEARYLRVTSKALAKERGVSETAQQSTESRSKQKLSNALAAAGLAALGALGVAVLVRPADRLVVVHVPLITDAGAAPVPAPTALADTTKQMAAMQQQLLEQAQRAADRKDFEWCVRDLAAAYPEGATAPSEVNKLRAACDEAALREMNSKGGR